MPKSSKTTWLNLRDLDVFGTPITGVGVEEEVKSLPMLETLHLAECRQLTNKGLQEILRISRSNLRYLNVFITPITGVGVEE